MNMPQGRLPVLPLRNSVVFPGLHQIIKVGRPGSIAALKRAGEVGDWIVAVLQKANTVAESVVDSDDILLIGTLCRVSSVKGTVENGYHLVLEGVSRVRLSETQITGGYLETNAISFADEGDLPLATSQALLTSIKDLSKSILRLLPSSPEHLVELNGFIDNAQDLSYLTSLCAGNLDISVEEKQKILETINLKDRSLILLTLMQEFRQNLQLHNEIRGKLSQKMSQAQRHSILREQMKQIREELGETGEANKEDQLRRKIMDAGLPEEIQKHAENELQRLAEVGNQSPEAHVIRNYLELLAALPWSKSSENQEINLDEAHKILEADHYGLEKVKKRIVQHLALLKIKKQSKGSILLFVGPPGVGKTSLGQSIAKALGKKFTRVSLGGVRDDAEIRGHRRTYIGAMPGRIIQGLKKAGQNDPVFLLDEIDKMSRAFQGDPASALLEVLDPEQNKTFLDHYLDVGFDLSKVFFIATANSLEGIPGPLLDRMEVIDLSGYTSAEKLHIAKNHLVPQQLAELGPLANVEFSEAALNRLITGYTREAGVRELQRKIASCLRAISEKILKSEGQLVRIESADLEELIGAERFSYEISESQFLPGVVTGLAWTPVGGDILFVESTQMPGRGELMITGQIGDVMKESAHIALSLLRSHLPQLGLSINLNRSDFHIHVPAGAIPKDGPSAGVSMLTSLASLMLKRPVSSKMAMTGEITLRGAVLPIGGVKEKIIAAHRAGITQIILPKKNEKDLAEVPSEIKKDLQFHLVSDIEELLQVALNISSINFFKLDNPIPLLSGVKSSPGNVQATLY